MAAIQTLRGPDLRDRAALALTAATRHPGIALMIANANKADRGVAAAVLDFMLVGIIVALPYQLWLKRRAASLSGSAERAPGPRRPGSRPGRARGTG